MDNKPIYIKKCAELCPKKSIYDELEPAMSKKPDTITHVLKICSVCQSGLSLSMCPAYERREHLSAFLPCRYVAHVGHLWVCEKEENEKRK